jgi:hypothetical protein
MTAATLYAVSAFGPWRPRRRSAVEREITARLRRELVSKLPAASVTPAGFGPVRVLTHESAPDPGGADPDCDQGFRGRRV